MNFELDADLARIQGRAQELATAIAPIASELDGSSSLDSRLVNALKESGLVRLVVPRSHGGEQAAVDPMAICIVREQFAAVSLHLDALFAMQGIGSFPITLIGTPQQRERWLPPIATLDVLAALAITEPEAGSDVRAVRTRAVPAADGSGLRLSGSKAFISNGGVAGFYNTLAKEGDGLSLFVVPADRRGVEVVPAPELMSPHVLGDLRFLDVPLQEGDRIGAPGQGLDHVLATLAVFRASVGAAAVGIAQRALDLAIRHTRERRQFGKPLIALQGVGALLADSWTEVEMSRLLVYRAAHRARLDPGSALVDSSMAKLAATEAAGRVVDRCLQVMGRFGLVHGSEIERLYRGVRPMRIYEGASEVLRGSLARALAAGGS